MRTVLQSDALQCLEGFVLVGHAVEVLREHDVLERGEVGNQVKLLENETDLLGADTVQLSCRNVRDVLAVQPDLAGGGSVQAANQIYQRRLAGPGRPHDRDPLAGIDGEGEVVESTDHTALGFRASGIEAADVLELDHLTLPSR